MSKNTKSWQDDEGNPLPTAEDKPRLDKQGEPSLSEKKLVRCGQPFQSTWESFLSDEFRRRRFFDECQRWGVAMFWLLFLVLLLMWGARIERQRRAKPQTVPRTDFSIGRTKIFVIQNFERVRTIEGTFSFWLENIL